MHVQTQVSRPDAVDGLGPVRASRAPSLVVRGKHSPYLTAELMARMAAVRSDVDLVTIPGSGHDAHTDQPDAVRAAVAAWMVMTVG